MQYYRHRLVSQGRCRWLGLLALVMQGANSSSNSLLKVMTTYICCLILCAQSAPGRCLHLGASVRGRLTGSSHAHVILKSQGAVHGISLLAVRASWMQWEPFHSKEWPLWSSLEHGSTTAGTDCCLSSPAWLQNCHTLTLWCPGPATDHLGSAPNPWGCSSWVISGSYRPIPGGVMMGRGFEQKSWGSRDWLSCFSHCSEELSLELLLVGSAELGCVLSTVLGSGCLCGAVWNIQLEKGAWKGSTVGLITPGVPIPAGDTRPAVREDWPFTISWKQFCFKKWKLSLQPGWMKMKGKIFVLESSILQSLHSQIIFSFGNRETGSAESQQK